MSFGYSVGDFVAGANLAYTLIRVMAETQSASEEYHEAMTELCGIQQAFIHVSHITRSSILPQATLNSASFIVLSSMEIIARFLERTREYRKRFESKAGGVGGISSSSWCKVGWSLYKRDELRSLRDSLHCRLVAVNTLFAAARHEHALPSPVSQYQDAEDEDAVSATESTISGITLMDNTFGPEPNTTGPVHRLGRIERKGIEKEVQERLEAARAEWEAERIATADEWRTEVEIQAKAAAMDEARAELGIEERVQERMKAAQEEMKNVEAELRARITKEAIERVKEDMKKETKPIRFKDAIGRKFTFPFHLVQTWSGMEELIKQAFLHVEVVGPQVAQGHYDLISPDGEVILPTVWERMVEPDWSITMVMWPMERMPPRPRMPGMPPGHFHLQGRPPMPGSHIPGHGHGSRPGRPPAEIIDVGPRTPLRDGTERMPPPVDASETSSIVSARSKSSIEDGEQDGKRVSGFGRLIPRKFAKLKMWKHSVSKKDEADFSDF